MNSLLQSISWMDAVALLVGIILVIRGFVKGATNQVARLVASLVAVGFGYFCFQPIFHAVSTLTFIGTHAYASYLIAIIVLFVVGIALWIIIGRSLASALQFIIRQPFDSILGGVIGGAEAILLIAILCVFGLMSPRQSDHSFIFHDTAVGRGLAPLLKPFAAPDDDTALSHPRSENAHPTRPASSQPAPFVKSTRRVTRSSR